MTVALSTASSRTQPAAGRGERLNPPKSSRVYWHLSALRDAYTAAIQATICDHDRATLVDYGCGNMPYRTLFPVANYVGADFPGNELANVLIEADGSLPLAEGSASVVLSSQVLEHVANVENYLSESHRILERDGLLFLSTHGVWRYHPDPCDFWRWTCDGLKRVIAKAGFELLFFQGVMGPEATALQLWQDAVSHRIPRRLRPLFHRFMQWRIRRADQRCSQPTRDRDACVYVLVARKTSR